MCVSVCVVVGEERERASSGAGLSCRLGRWVQGVGRVLTSSSLLTQSPAGAKLRAATKSPLFSPAAGGVPGAPATTPTPTGASAPASGASLSGVGGPGGVTMASVVSAKMAARNKRWGGLFGGGRERLVNSGLPGYKSLFSSKPGEGPLEKALAGTACTRLYVYALVRGRACVWICLGMWMCLGDVFGEGGGWKSVRTHGVVVCGLCSGLLV